MTEPVIALRGVRKILGGKEVLRGVDLEVCRGDVFGYLGPNGAGKTTTIRIILGLLRHDAGTVSLFGGDPSPEAARRLGFVLEHDGLFDGLTAAENLRLFARIYGVRAPRVGELLELVGLPGRERERAGTFSKGMRQRLALARALIHDPDVLILDEPTAGLDPSGQMEIRDLISGLAARGKTIFLSSHNLDEVERLCNRVALIAAGEIRAQGEMAELRRRDGGRPRYVAELASPPPEDALDRLREEFPALGLVEARDRALVFAPEGAGMGEIATALEGLGLELEGIRRDRLSLEELYRRIVEGG